MPGSRIAKLLVAALLALAGADARAAPKCLRYGPEATLVGTLEEKIVAGPPHYESVKKGDWKEKGWYVNLPNPICVDRAGRKSKLKPAVQDVTVVQLVIYESEDWKRWRPLLGDEVKIKGRLIHTQRARFVTPLLIEVKSLEAARRRR